MSEFEIYKSTSKTKMPDDGLIESECSRFKNSRKDFGIVFLSEINRYMAISPAVQFEIFKKESDANKMMEEWKKRMDDALIPVFEKKEDLTEIPEVPQEFLDFLDKLKKFIPDRHPGRLPTISIADPDGGFWVSNWARSVSSLQPIFIPTVRFDLTPPVLYYVIPDGVHESNEPSIDAAFHAYFYAGIEGLGGVMTIPVRAKEKEGPSLATDGNLPLNDLSIADFIYGRIVEDGLWRDRQNNPFIASLGSSNTVAISMQVEQLESLFETDFFVQFD